jgi:hypothetical protein
MSTDVSEEHIASIVRFEGLAEQESSGGEQSCLPPAFTPVYFWASSSTLMDYIEDMTLANTKNLKRRYRFADLGTDKKIR